MRRQPISKKKKALIIRRVVFVLAIFLIAAIQNTPHVFPSFFGSNALLLIPLVVCFGMFETALTAALMGALAGALWDMNLDVGDGFNALMLMLFATLASLLISYLMRNNMSTAILLGGVSIVLYSVLHWFFFIICGGVDGGLATLFTFYLPTTVYTLIFVPVFYFILRSFLRKIKD